MFKLDAKRVEKRNQGIEMTCRKCSHSLEKEHNDRVICGMKTDGRGQDLD